MWINEEDLLEALESSEREKIQEVQEFLKQPLLRILFGDKVMREVAEIAEKRLAALDGKVTNE